MPDHYVDWQTLDDVYFDWAHLLSWFLNNNLPFNLQQKLCNASPLTAQSCYANNDLKGQEVYKQLGKPSRRIDNCSPRQALTLFLGGVVALASQ